MNDIKWMTLLLSMSCLRNWIIFDSGLHDCLYDEDSLHKFKAGKSGLKVLGHLHNFYSMV